jgi:hypothetical protein
MCNERATPPAAKRPSQVDTLIYYRLLNPIPISAFQVSALKFQLSSFSSQVSALRFQLSAFVFVFWQANRPSAQTIFSFVHV